ncbi:PrsW family glutamic-type intramembrane protease [Thermofilum sp.]|uniref:PrsW family glutamic-type intramembrane protease n=1 Tax=Thermofilum sp. TaxID=1961369 RepID=UPI003168253D
MASVTCWSCGQQNDSRNLYCINCGQPLRAKMCPSCGQQVQVNANACPRCGYSFQPQSLSAYRYSMNQSTPYVEPSFTPRRSLIENVKLIHNLIFSKRPPIYRASQEVYGRLPWSTINSSGKYLNYALFSILAGVGLVFLISLTEGVVDYFVVAFVTAIIPALMYLLWMSRNDRFEPEPAWMIALAFGWGALSTLPAIILNDLTFSLVGGWSGVAGLTEEPSKMLGVYLMAVSPNLRNEFNDHLDGLIYGAAAGLGFGFVENILYITRLVGENPLIIGIRAITIGMHMFCTGLIGWWMGYLKVHGISINLTNILPALAYSATLHMCWNTIGSFEYLSLIVFIAGPILVLYLNKMAKEALIDEYYWGFASGYAPVEMTR